MEHHTTGSIRDNSRMRKVRSLGDASSTSCFRGKTTLIHGRIGDDSTSCKASNFSSSAAATAFTSERRHPFRRKLSSSGLQELTLSSELRDQDPLFYQEDQSSSTGTTDSANVNQLNDGSSPIMKFLFVSTKSRLGFISLLLVGAVTASNMILDLVDAQIHSLDGAGYPYYDTLSPEVIRPAFVYKSNTGIHSQIDRPRLGTAAISSVTEALSPILPFTGGLDLRREWEITNSISNIIDQVRDAFGFETIPRGGSQEGALGTDSVKLTRAASGRKKIKTKHITALSASTPFVPIDMIASMTLADLTEVFSIAVDINRDGRTSKKQAKKSEHLVPILSKMEQAIATSRGKGVEPSLTKAKSSDEFASLSAAGFGDVDALQFCAAMRLFAEWRVVRQVPDGYKGYAVGMNLGQKDIVQNVAKIESAVHNWLDHRRGLLELEAAWLSDASSVKDGGSTLRSPTLRDLLEHEIDMEVHGNRLPRLKDKTAAMGLLWVRRQLHYQTEIFANVLEVPNRFPNAIAAVTAAYTEVYGKLHGWAVQKIFNYSFQAAPEAPEIYKFMDPKRLREVMEEAQTLTSSTSSELQEATSPLLQNEGSQNPFEQLGNHIASEWGKLLNHFNGGSTVGATDANKQQNPLASEKGLVGQELENFICTKMSETARVQIIAYLDVVKPLLRDFSGLFDELNMDDPTKV